MSLYGDYLKERTEDLIIETSTGFATYRYISPTTVYIVDIYVRPEVRKSGEASRLANEIAREARERGCTEMLGTVVPTFKNATASLKVLFAYGMTLLRADEKMIVCRKDI